MNIPQWYRIRFLLTICCSVASAQIEKKAQVGFRFLENPVSAEAVGRGMVGLTSTRSSDAVFWNPALLGWLEPTLDISLHHTKGIADINYNAAAGAFRLGDFGVIGFSFLAMDYGTFYDFDYHGIRFGATLQNISKEIKYEDEAFPLPFAVSFGLGLQPLTFFSDASGAQNSDSEYRYTPSA